MSIHAPSMGMVSWKPFSCAVQYSRLLLCRKSGNTVAPGHTAPATPRHHHNQREDATAILISFVCVYKKTRLCICQFGAAHRCTAARRCP